MKVIGIRENNVNKKAIYYGIYDSDWFDSMAVENFSNNIIDLIELGDYVNGEIVTKIKEWNSLIDGNFRYVVTCHYEIIRADEIKSIVTKEQFKEMEYRVDE